MLSIYTSLIRAEEICKIKHHYAYCYTMPEEEEKNRLQNFRVDKYENGYCYYDIPHNHTYCDFTCYHDEYGYYSCEEKTITLPEDAVSKFFSNELKLTEVFPKLMSLYYESKYYKSVFNTSLTIPENIDDKGVSDYIINTILPASTNFLPSEENFTWFEPTFKQWDTSFRYLCNALGLSNDKVKNVVQQIIQDPSTVTNKQVTEALRLDFTQFYIIMDELKQAMQNKPISEILKMFSIEETTTNTVYDNIIQMLEKDSLNPDNLGTIILSVINNLPAFVSKVYDDTEKVITQIYKSILGIFDFKSISITDRIKNFVSFLEGSSEFLGEDFNETAQYLIPRLNQFVNGEILLKDLICNLTGFEDSEQIMNTIDEILNGKENFIHTARTILTIFPNEDLEKVLDVVEGVFGVIKEGKSLKDLTQTLNLNFTELPIDNYIDMLFEPLDEDVVDMITFYCNGLIDETIKDKSFYEEFDLEDLPEFLSRYKPMEPIFTGELEKLGSQVAPIINETSNMIDKILDILSSTIPKLYLDLFRELASKLKKTAQSMRDNKNIRIVDILSLMVTDKHDWEKYIPVLLNKESKNSEILEALNIPNQFIDIKATIVTLASYQKPKQNARKTMDSSVVEDSTITLSIKDILNSIATPKDSEISIYSYIPLDTFVKFVEDEKENIKSGEIKATSITTALNIDLNKTVTNLESPDISVKAIILAVTDISEETFTSFNNSINGVMNANAQELNSKLGYGENTPKKSNTAIIVVCCVIGVLVIAGVIGGFLYMKSKDDDEEHADKDEEGIQA